MDAADEANRCSQSILANMMNHMEYWEHQVGGHVRKKCARKWTTDSCAAAADVVVVVAAADVAVADVAVAAADMNHAVISRVQVAFAAIENHAVVVLAKGHYADPQQPAACHSFALLHHTSLGAPLSTMHPYQHCRVSQTPQSRYPPRLPVLLVLLLAGLVYYGLHASLTRFDVLFAQVQAYLRRMPLQVSLTRLSFWLLHLSTLPEFALPPLVDSFSARVHAETISSL